MELFIILTGLTLLSGCGHQSHDPRLEKVSVLANEDPKQAQSLIDSLASSTLPEQDRHYFEFLRLKTADKLYVRHTSDSLIKSLIDYAALHKQEGWYAEALYYGGRVYSDLGDHPTALRYFQDALRECSERGEDLDLQGRILSQTGRLMSDLKLYSAAIPYIKMAIENGRILRDTVAQMDDWLLLGWTYYYKNVDDSAIYCFNKVRSLNQHIANQDKKLRSQIGLAAAAYEKGNYSNALRYIRNIPEQTKGTLRNMALVHAAKTYYRCGILDSAYLYAEQLIHCEKPLNKKTGYDLLLTTELKDRIKQDSVIKYMSDFRGLVEDYYKANDAAMVSLQQSHYNYHLHIEKRLEAEQSINNYKMLLLICILAIILIFAAYMSERIRLQKRIIKLQSTKAFLSDELRVSACDINDKKKYPIPTLNNARELQTSLRKEILGSLSSISNPINPDLLTSESHKLISDKINNKKIGKTNSEFWEMIERDVLSIYPDFKNKLQFLIGGKLDSLDWKMALLTKYGVSQSEMVSIINKTKSTVSYRKKNLGVKLLGVVVPSKELDNILRIL